MIWPKAVLLRNLNVAHDKSLPPTATRKILSYVVSVGRC